MRTRSEESEDSIPLDSKEYPKKDYIGYTEKSQVNVSNIPAFIHEVGSVAGVPQCLPVVMVICDQSSRSTIERSDADVG